MNVVLLLLLQELTLLERVAVASDGWLVRAGAAQAGNNVGALWHRQ